jgi:hypothetical protein
MRSITAPLTSTLCLALALIAAPAFVPPALQAEDKKDHDHKHDDKKKDGEKHDHGEEHKLGEITLNGTAFTVSLIGHVKAGEEVEVKLMTTGALPKGTVRAWIGAESGKGSAKGKAHDEDGGLCVHAEVPNPVPADAKVWVELDGGDGKAKAGLGLPKE